MRKLPFILLLWLALASPAAGDELVLLGNPHAVAAASWPGPPLDAELVQIAATPPCCAPCISYLRLDSLMLARTFAGIPQPLVLDTAGNEVLGTADISFAFTAGPRITWGFPRVCGDNWEWSYFGGVNWESSTSAAAADDLRLPDPLGGVVPDFFAADQMQVDYSSEIQSLEFNHYRPVGFSGPWSWLGGFRYVHYEEDLNLFAIDSDTGNSTYDVGTTNNLVGGQLGARWHVEDGRWDWEFLGKVGVYANFAGQRQIITDLPGTVLRDARGEKSFAAMVADIGFSGTRQLGRRWSLRAGYNLIVLSGVALAPDQLDFSAAPGAGNVADARGAVLLHGAVVGLEARW